MYGSTDEIIELEASLRKERKCNKILSQALIQIANLTNEGKSVVVALKALVKEKDIRSENKI